MLWIIRKLSEKFHFFFWLYLRILLLQAIFLISTKIQLIEIFIILMNSIRKNPMICHFVQFALSHFPRIKNRFLLLNQITNFLQQLVFCVVIIFTKTAWLNGFIFFFFFFFCNFIYNYTKEMIKCVHYVGFHSNHKKCKSAKFVVNQKIYDYV